MDFRYYLSVATTLVNGSVEAEWRSAISRAYYAAFHVARQLLLGMSFRVPSADRAHGHLWMRLANAGQPDVEDAGNRLNALRRDRNRADYDAHVSVNQASARVHVRRAEEIIQALDAASVEPTRSQITDAMKVYERDVLHDVTWRP